MAAGASGEDDDDSDSAVNSRTGVGQLVRVRVRAWVVAEMQASSTLHGDLRGNRQHLLELTSVEDDGLDDELTVIWEIEPGATILETATLPRPRLDHFDSRTLQAPFRSGI